MKANLFKLCALLAAVLSGGLASAVVRAAGDAVPGAVDGSLAQLIGWGTGGLVVAGLWLRSKLSRDGVALKADSYLKDALDRATLNEAELKKERDQALADARAAWASKNADALELGQLRAQVDFLQQQLQQANATIGEIRRGVQAVGQKVDAVKRGTDKALSDSGLVPLSRE